ncbi:5'-methylthioadenosine/adenosylhomocysteine nucleosidase [Synechococcus sp. N26]|uniref:5'-methylthioadenosine/adenosylhomocysteine nucleosidase n=1 Tax=Synechococcus sp. N26 TaxID=2575513 RepID=UPI000E0E16B0|nr:5'-methylthioadenosine/adenosylhomocysteine nucleosidase [Synechococcus sp. N26]
MTQPLHLGLLGAMPEEIGSDLSHLKDLSCSDHGDLKIHRGSWGDEVRLSLAWSGWGKVSAARAATRLLASDPSIDLLVFTGVAGAADPILRQWDVVLADAVVQHDMDARPLFTRFTVPALKKEQLQPQPAWFNWAETALREAHSAGDLDGFAQPSSGLIATGDRFISNPAVLQTLRNALPDLRAVEMEGAAVAQVAEQEGVPWLVLRVISDGADAAAAQSFEDFVKLYEKQAWRLIEALLQRCNNTPRHCA